MKKKFNVYYNNQKIDNKYSDQLAKTIFELGLKKGDTLFCFPFNYFDDEKSEHFPGKLDYHDKCLEIEKIEINLIETWNGYVNSVVEIFTIPKT